MMRVSIPQGSRSFELFDDPQFTARYEVAEADDAWLRRCEQELDFRFDLSQPPLGRCTVLGHPASARADIVLTFPHTLVDGTAVTQLAKV